MLAAALVCGCTSAPKYDWNSDLQHRLANDFCQTRQEVKEYIAKHIPDVTDEQIDAWTASGKLENMEINGETMYFENAGRNLFRIDPACNAIWNAGKDQRILPDYSGYQNSNIADIISDANAAERTRKIMASIAPKADGADAASGASTAAATKFYQPKTFNVKYKVIVNADAVPEGETLRCWLPFPRTDLPRQSGVKLISVSESKYTAAAEGSRHNTIYMEKKAVKGEPTVFEEEFKYTSAGEYYDLRDYKAAAYDTTSELWKEYTAEQPPHIVFTDQMKALSDSLTAGLENPVDKARAIFIWINDNFPWASAREYSTVPCIPEYVLGCGHGDCGQVTLLLMTLCRIQGIPAHFQSGFVIKGDEAGLHDWSELYFEDLGWVPVDQSRGLWEDAVRTIPFTCDPAQVVVPDNYRPDYAFENPSFADFNDKYLWFHFGGIDSYRLVVNSDFGCELSPKKTFPRSETVDFQRGEVEWRGGNLYFDQWHRETTVEQVAF